METVEKTGRTIDEAIAAGLAELGVDASMVMVEVIEEPDPGIMGEGARLARVRLILMGGRPLPPKPVATPRPMPERFRDVERERRKAQDVTERDAIPDSSPPSPEREQRPRRGGSRRSGSRSESPSHDAPARAPRPRAKEADQFTPPAPDEITDSQADETALTAKLILTELLAKMGMDEVHVGIRRGEQNRPAHEGQTPEEDDDDIAYWILNISGKNTHRLIGRRAETLTALQYILRLILNKRVQTRTTVVVDAAEYKAHRTDRLRQLANRMADQALSQKRMVSLEPMPPHERRIIHLTLRHRKDVITKSVGEGETRKVTISPAEPKS